MGRGRKRRAVAATAGAGLALVALSGCSSADLEQWQRFGMPEPVTDRAEHVLSLWQGSWIAALAVGVLVWGLILWAVWAYRKKDDSIPAQTRYHVPLEMLYTFVPFVIIAVLFYFTVREQNAILHVDEENPPDHVVNVVAQQWSWTFNYREGAGGEGVWNAGTPAEIPELYLPVGERVGIELQSPDVIHSFFVPAFLFKLDVIPGRDNYFEITPTVEGEFAGKCAELCGTYHARMLFTVHIVSQEEYEQHLSELEAQGQTGEATGGEQASTQRGLEPDGGEDS